MNPEVIREWFEAYGDDVHNFIAYFLKRRDVEDLVQETFLKALKGLDKYRGMSHPKTWLFAIARRVAMDHSRRLQHGKHTYIELFELPSTDSKPDVLVERSDSLRHILTTLNGAKESYRSVILLRIIMDLSITDTAEILGWTESRVKVTLHRALAFLRKNWDTTQEEIINA